MQKYFIVVILLFLLLISIPKINEPYSSLDVYYHTSNNKQPADGCGECAGLCLFCNKGKITPNSCNGHGNEMKNICTNLNSLKNMDFLNIISLPYDKYLTFEQINNNKYTVFINKSSQSQSQSQSQNLINNNTKNENTPMKWQFIEVDKEKCYYYIVTKNKPKYYIEANKNGSITVSLFKGGKSQYWQIIPIIVKNNTAFLIKSVQHCTYLAATKDGYIYKNSGLAFLTNISDKTNLENNYFWTFTKNGSKFNTQTSLKFNKEIPIIASKWNGEYIDDKERMITILVQDKNDKIEGEGIFNHQYFTLSSNKLNDNKILIGNSIGGQKCEIKITMLKNNIIHVKTTNGDDCELQKIRE